jgi:hypothetical protein
MPLPSGRGFLVSAVSCDNQDLTLHTLLSDEIATVSQTLR